MKISLIGYMGSGKTTIAKFLTQKAGFVYIDLDKEIEKIENKSVEDIFKDNGELYFRKKENEVLKQVLKLNNKIVLSTGGGTPVFYDNIEFINQNSISFYLYLSPNELAKRLIKQKNNRPLIKHLNNENITEFVAKHLFERNKFYQQAKHTINCQNKSVDEIVMNIIKIIKSEN